MNETEPNYITGLRNHIDDKIENTEPKYFKEFKLDIKKHVDLSINELAVMIKDTVATKDDIKEIWDNMATKDDIKNMATKDDIKNLVTKEDFEYEINEIKNSMATKEDVSKILSHIGVYEIRAKNVEDILLHDHKPRIKDLEKEVFA